MIGSTDFLWGKMLRKFTLVFCTAGMALAADSPFDGSPSFEADGSISWADEGPGLGGVRNFCQFNVEYEYIFKSDFSNGPNSLGFAEGTATMSYTKFMSQSTALNVGIGYTSSFIDWPNDPFFSQENFDTFNMNLNGFAHFFDGGLELKGGASANQDTRHWGFGEYAFYMLTGWGRVAFNTTALGEVGVNLGATGRAGLKRGFIYPIAGIDFRPSEDLKVNLIFPIDMAVIYSLSEHWSASLTAKIWNSRRKWGDEEPVPSGYWEYRNQGIELGLNYEWDPIAAFNIHAGTTFGNGDIRISNSQDVEIGTFNYGAAPYLGGELWFRF